MLVTVVEIRNVRLAVHERIVPVHVPVPGAAHRVRVDVVVVAVIVDVFVVVLRG